MGTYLRSDDITALNWIQPDTELVPVVAASGQPLLRLGLRTAFESCPDMMLAGLASSVEELIAVVESVRPAAALIGSDLPDGDAVDAAMVVREAHPRCGLVLLGPRSDTLLFRALDAQLSAFVPTSSSTAEIVAAMRTAAHTPRSFSAPDLAGALARRDRLRGLLSTREQQVLTMLRDGSSIGEIARAMALGESTVKTYVSRLYDKLGVNSRAAAIAASRAPAAGTRIP